MVRKSTKTKPRPKKQKPKVSKPKAAKPEPAPTTGQSFVVPPMKTAFVSGLSEEGELVFQVFGEDLTLVELLGLKEFTQFKISQVLGQQQMAGDTLTNEVGQAVKALHTKLDHLAQELGHPLLPNKG